ncbi:putative decarboxylase tpcK [Lachnellula arida]|uniref:Putative decarboxylase tpcK n=1 Tax=Lachnellula arida TaxID=1316785 RepID=A0A8T9BII5_9HELO|nr:putative decarboxylase tpcK [Lachnellula arida]
MASNDQKPQRLFQWTVCAYKKEGMDDEEYHKYLGEKHGPLTAPFLAKYGILKHTVVHNTTETKKLMAKIAGPDYDNFADYDCFVQCIFRDVEDFVRFQQDPAYATILAPDHDNFADTTKSN